MIESTPDSLPITEAEVHEVAPRDGFQMIRNPIPTELKLAVITKLVEAGCDAIQITSFVNPRAVPQMSDSTEVVQAVLAKHGERRFSVLVPNLKGAELAISAGISRLDFVISVSEKHNLENVGMDHERSWAQLAHVQQRFPDAILRLDLATLFSCPFAGETSLEDGIAAVQRAVDAGIQEIGLSDTMGSATPAQTRRVLAAVRERYPEQKFVLHFHDTDGMAMLNYFVAARLGFASFDTSIAGLGGCPFAPGASGNLATEDLVNMFDSVGVRTGINLQILMQAAQLVKERIEPQPSGRLVNKLQAEASSKGDQP